MRARILAALLLVSAAFVPTADAQSEDDALRPVLSEVQAVYGSEAWKDVNATIGQATSSYPGPPIPGGSETGVYKNPYSSPDHGHQPPASTNLGYRLVANVSLESGDGGSPSGDSDYVIDGRIESSAGIVPVRIAKVSNRTFEVVADLDGENRHGYPALTLGGDAVLNVEVYEDPPDPTVEPQIVATSSFRLEVSNANMDRPGTLFQEASVPGFDDVGATNYTQLRTEVVAPDERLEVTVTFPAAPGERVIAQLFRGTTGTQVFTGRTGPNGSVTFNFQPGQALPAGDESGLLVLETHVKGANSVLGSRPVVIPVSPHPMTVSSVKHEERSGENTSTVRVAVQDANDNPQNNSRRGTLYVMKGTDVVTETTFGTPESPDPSARTARFPARAIQEPGYTSYDLVAFFFDDRDDFYSLATADRGAAVRLDTEAVEPNREAVLTVTVDNENDNRNDETDPGLVLTAQVQVNDLHGAEDTVVDQVIVPEGETGTAEIPHTPTEVGTHSFTVNVTAGEIELDLLGAVEVQESGLVDDVLSEDDLLDAPGPALPALLLAGLAAVLLRRRD